MSVNNYSVKQIKEAFWRTFHKRGEIWFDYLDTEEMNNKSTEEEWIDFLEELKKLK